MLDNIRNYYSDKIVQHGPSPAGVDWNSEATQLIRFEQLSKLFLNIPSFSVLDFGCGYGALYNFLAKRFDDFSYIGYDISPEMCSVARNFLSKYPASKWSVTQEYKGILCDFVIASGIFNVKLEESNTAWENHLFKTLQLVNSLAQNGFAFNILTKYSDIELQKDYLYYADPAKLFDFCKLNFSRNIALLHDYDLYEFTIIVKK